LRYSKKQIDHLGKQNNRLACLFQEAVEPEIISKGKPQEKEE